MIVAQVIIILPVIISVSTELLEQIFMEYKEIFDSFDVSLKNRIKTTVFDARIPLITCILTGLGRALSEVGAIIIVGGNIIHYTRVMTTTIALETSKGNLEMAMSLGIVLILISIGVNAIVMIMKMIARDILMIKNTDHIQLKNINFIVNKKLFFNNLCLNLSTSGITVILGPNGSGKSLLTKIIKGLIKSESGSLSIKLEKINSVECIFISR